MLFNSAIFIFAFLPLALIVYQALLRLAPFRVAIAWLVQGVGHLAYHVGHLDGVTGADRVGLVGSLVVIPALAALALGVMVMSPGRQAS